MGHHFKTKTFEIFSGVFFVCRRTSALASAQGKAKAAAKPLNGGETSGASLEVGRVSLYRGGGVVPLAAGAAEQSAADSLDGSGSYHDGIAEFFSVSLGDFPQ